jgi:hypothetical protein
MKISQEMPIYQYRSTKVYIPHSTVLHIPLVSSAFAFNHRNTMWRKQIMKLP